jgi:hypothetical protein
MMIPAELIEIKEYTDTGYSPVIDFDAWRVAVLNYISELNAENITSFSRHLETDEIFVLLRGKCCLFLGEESQGEIVRIHPVMLEPYKIYNVRRNAWHTHALDKEASVLIVENANTSKLNTPDLFITHEQHRLILEAARKHLS